MTFKSIETILNESVQAGLIHPFVPVMDADEMVKRQLYITPKMKSYINGEHAQKSASEYYASVRASLGEFVKGEEVLDDQNYLKKLKPYHENIWEIKITFKPQARLFGAFVGLDRFVALSAALRKDCDDGGFDKHRELVKTRWAEIFGNKPRNSCWPLIYCITGVGV